MTRIKLFFLVVTLFTLNGAYAQRLWTSVKVNKSAVYIGQPVEVSIEAYTSTWFTSGIDPGNIQVDGAFTQYFRPVSKSIRMDGKTYAGVELIYQVFPYENDELVFPSIAITVESPPEGGYKGVQHVLNTEEKRIRIKPIPSDFSRDQWLVATGLTIADNWSTASDKVKTGDVVTRTVTRTVYGTVPELIPPLEWDSISGLAMYPARSSIRKFDTKTSVYATRTESVRYLFTEEGNVTIPAEVIYWFHASQEKLYKKTLSERNFTVEPNPNLGIVASIQDSLDALARAEMVTETAEDGPVTILGLPWTQFLTVCVAGLGVLWVLVVLIRWLIKKEKARRIAYKNSEKYAFDQFKDALKRDSGNETVNRLYRWLDHLGLDEPTVDGLLHASGVIELTAERVKVDSFSNSDSANLKLDPETWKNARKKFLNRPVPQHNSNDWINP